jgi:hypothetical protein
MTIYMYSVLPQDITNFEYNASVQGISRMIIMSPTELKMKPTIHLQS